MEVVAIPSPVGPPPGPSPEEVVALERADNQIKWYSVHATRNALSYNSLKLVAIISAAAIPVLTAAKADTLIAAALGALLVSLEGIQQLLQLHRNWVVFATTAEGLKRERFLFLTRAGPYGKVHHPVRLLSEQTEALVTRETSSWIATMQTSRSSASEGGGNEDAA